MSGQRPRRVVPLALGALVLCLVLGLVLSFILARTLDVGVPVWTERETERQPVSVLLVSPDSLRVDRLPAWGPAAAHGSLDGDPPPTPTPHLDELAARGTLYDNAWATAPWTAPSMVSVMTGLFPPAHGVAYRDDTTPPGVASLPRLLASRGYEIGNFSFFSQISYFRNLGLGPTEDGLKAHRQVPGAFAGWLEQLAPERPFFAWVHLLETHLPYGATGYRAPEAKVEGSSGLELAQTRGTVPVGSTRFADGDRAALLDLYDQDVAAMDEALGRVLQALDDTGRRGSTLVVYVADHGEELLDAPPHLQGDVEEGRTDAWVGHASTAVEAHLYPQIVRVPLVLAGPGVPRGERRSDLVSQADILPSVLRLLGLPTPEHASRHHLPGAGDRVFDLLLPRREHVFFDSSPGGNLTPQDQRHVRIQGAGDGLCVLEERVLEERRGERSRSGEDVTVRTFGPEEPCRGRTTNLRRALDDWRRQQAEIRLRLLAESDGGPDPEMADAWPASLTLQEPSRRVLRHGETGGRVTLAWSGSGSRSFGGPLDERPDGEPTRDTAYWVEYRSLGSRAIGAGLVRGMFQVEQTRVDFGPVPPGYWNDLAIYSPFEIRVLDPNRELRSQWVRFEMEEAE